jgi:HD superfamily phosphohydrolase YqeK
LQLSCDLHTAVVHTSGVPQCSTYVCVVYFSATKSQDKSQEKTSIHEIINKLFITQRMTYNNDKSLVTIHTHTTHTTNFALIIE